MVRSKCLSFRLLCLFKPQSTVRVSYVEIHKERVIDLLAAEEQTEDDASTCEKKQPASLDVREDSRCVRRSLPFDTRSHAAEERSMAGEASWPWVRRR